MQKSAITHTLTIVSLALIVVFCLPFQAAAFPLDETFTPPGDYLSSDGLLLDLQNDDDLSCLGEAIVYRNYWFNSDTGEGWLIDEGDVPFYSLSWDDTFLSMFQNVGATEVDGAYTVFILYFDEAPPEASEGFDIGNAAACESWDYPSDGIGGHWTLDFPEQETATTTTADMVNTSINMVFSTVFVFFGSLATTLWIFKTLA